MSKYTPEWKPNRICEQITFQMNSIFVIIVHPFLVEKHDSRLFFDKTITGAISNTLSQQLGLVTIRENTSRMMTNKRDLI